MFYKYQYSTFLSDLVKLSGHRTVFWFLYSMTMPSGVLLTSRVSAKEAGDEMRGYSCYNVTDNRN